MDIPVDSLLDNEGSDPTDSSILAYVSNFLDGVDLSDYVVEKSESVINLRPTAQFGS